MSKVIYAIGDVHGRDDLLETLHGGTKDLHALCMERSLDGQADHGPMVVDGHTPGDDPVVRANMICVDTGATSNGVLTSAFLDGTNPPLSLRATETMP